MNIIISVIVPCYNQAQYLPEALDSVLQQSYANWECIIVNDGSTDNTEGVTEKYLKIDNRFKYISQQNKGLSAARNTGVTSSVGEYILPLDADDKIGPNYIKKAIHFFEKNTGTSLVYCQAELFGARTGKWQLKPYSYMNLLSSNMIFCSSIFKRVDFDAAGGYDERMKRGYEDWEFYLRLLKSDSTVHQLKEHHFYYRIKQKSMLADIGIADEQELNNYIYNKHQDIYKTYFASPINLIRKLEMYEAMYKNSADYKLGNKLLNPFRVFVHTIKSMVK